MLASDPHGTHRSDTCFLEWSSIIFMPVFFGTLKSDKNFVKLNGHQPLLRHKKTETYAVSLQIGKTFPNSVITESLLNIRNLVTIIPPKECRHPTFRMHLFFSFYKIKGCGS